MPIELALAAANDSTALRKVLVAVSNSEELRYTWERTERTKKLQWMITCGLGAASVVYAYTGVALHHEDQSAKEMTAMTGLPSSDGAPIPESSVEDSRVDRLDKTWEKVVGPMLKSFISICGVDRLKVHGWAMLDAITSQRESTWTLDRLLSPRYLSGEAFLEGKESNMKALLDELEADSIRASEIPSWGSTWTARRLDLLLDLFEDCLSGISGINDMSSVKWVRDDQGNALMPLILSRIWSNLLRALSCLREEDAFTDGLELVTGHLIQIFNRDPTTYVPIAVLDAGGGCTVDVDAIRVGLVTWLFDAMVVILGRDALGATRLNTMEGEEEVDDAERETIAQMAFGSDSNGQATVAGCFLGQILRARTLSFPLQPSARSGFKRLIGKVLDVGSVQGFSGKLLGDLTNQMPWIFAEQEEIQLDVWRLLGEGSR